MKTSFLPDDEEVSHLIEIQYERSSCYEWLWSNDLTCLWASSRLLFNYSGESNGE